MLISIVIPTLNESDQIQQLLGDLAPYRAQGHELILVDGGSSDNTLQLAQPMVDQILHSKPGRAQQMNVGAVAARHELLWFVHADSRIRSGSVEALVNATRDVAGWGRFDVALSGRHPLLRIVERSMNWRSRLSGIATGDQGIFVNRSLFRQIGGYAEIPLMEDIELSKRLRQIQRPACIRTPRLITSSRRWEQKGIVRTITLMWKLRLAYALGADPTALATTYRQ